MADAEVEFEPGNRFQIGNSRGEQLLVKVISRCRGEARDVAGTGNLLTFELQLDQTQLFATMVQLSELLNRYPVRGSPAA